VEKSVSKNRRKVQHTNEKSGRRHNKPFYINSPDAPMNILFMMTGLLRYNEKAESLMG